MNRHANFDCLVCGRDTDHTSLAFPIHGDYRVAGSCAFIWRSVWDDAARERADKAHFGENEPTRLRLVHLSEGD